MYTIFINEKVVYLCESQVGFEVDLSLNFDAKQLSHQIDKLASTAIRSLAIVHSNLPALWHAFKKEFKLITAAGGVVFNEKDEILWIYRNNTWDLPKGKVEKNESVATAAVREVKEECGVTQLNLVCPMIKTYHVYPHKGRQVLKITHWFKMQAQSDQKLNGQTEEGITKVCWLDTVKMQEAFENTYENIKLLCKFAAL